MVFRILLHPKAKKALDKLDPEIMRRIRETLFGIKRVSKKRRTPSIFSLLETKGWRLQGYL